MWREREHMSQHEMWREQEHVLQHINAGGNILTPRTIKIYLQKQKAN
jgi:hypothetical protein